MKHNDRVLSIAYAKDEQEAATCNINFESMSPSKHGIITKTQLVMNEHNVDTGLIIKTTPLDEDWPNGQLQIAHYKNYLFVLHETASRLTLHSYNLEESVISTLGTNSVEEEPIDVSDILKRDKIREERINCIGAVN